MLKLNKKGVTLIELIVSFALVATAVIYFYQTLSTVYDLYATSRKETQEYVDKDYALRILDAKINDDASSIQDGDTSFCDTYMNVNPSKKYCDEIEVATESDNTKFNIKKGNKTLTSLAKASIPQILSTNNDIGSAAFYPYFNGYGTSINPANNVIIVNGSSTEVTYIFDEIYDYEKIKGLKIEFSNQSSNSENFINVFDFIAVDGSDLNVTILRPDNTIREKDINEHGIWVTGEITHYSTKIMTTTDGIGKNFKFKFTINNDAADVSYTSIKSIIPIYKE